MDTCNQVSMKRIRWQIISCHKKYSGDRGYNRVGQLLPNTLGNLEWKDELRTLTTKLRSYFYDPSETHSSKVKISENKALLWLSYNTKDIPEFSMYLMLY